MNLLLKSAPKSLKKWKNSMEKCIKWIREKPKVYTTFSNMWRRIWLLSRPSIMLFNQEYLKASAEKDLSNSILKLKRQLVKISEIDIICKWGSLKPCKDRCTVLDQKQKNKFNSWTLPECQLQTTWSKAWYWQQIRDHHGHSLQKCRRLELQLEILLHQDKVLKEIILRGSSFCWAKDGNYLLSCSSSYS